MCLVCPYFHYYKWRHWTSRPLYFSLFFSCAEGKGLTTASRVLSSLISLCLFSAIKSIIDTNQAWDDWSYLALLFTRTFAEGINCEHICSLRVSSHSFWANQSMNRRFSCLTYQRFCWHFHTRKLKLNHSLDFDVHLFWMFGISRTTYISIYYWNPYNTESKKRLSEVKLSLFRRF